MYFSPMRSSFGKPAAYREGNLSQRVGFCRDLFGQLRTEEGCQGRQHRHFLCDTPFAGLERMSSYDEELRRIGCYSDEHWRMDQKRLPRAIPEHDQFMTGFRQF